MNSAPRCFLPPSDWVEGEPISLPAEEAHHLARVLRIQPGQRVRVFDGRGREADAVVQTLGRVGLSVLLRQTFMAPRPAAHVILFQAILKNERMDEVVQKAVELGAAELAPLAADQSVVRLSHGNLESRMERWRKIAMGAARQSGNPFLLDIRDLQPASASCQEAASLDLAVFGSLEGETRPLWDLLGGIRHRRGVRIGLWIGPEGDWSPSEYSSLRRAGILPANLGPLVLRAETAVFYSLSVVGAAFTAGSAAPARP